MSVSSGGSGGSGGGDNGQVGGTPRQPPGAAVVSPLTARSSRMRFREFLARQRSRTAEPEPGARLDPSHPSRVRRNRGFFTLLREFWALMEGRRWLIGLCVGTVTVSALAALAMPASTKIALDYILGDTPGPSGLPDWVPTRDRKQLLWWLGGALMSVNIVSIALGIWGRWSMTRLAIRTRVRIRRRVFEHAVRLPLHRVYQLKSGGAASFLREDTGNAASLLFSLLYNPWRAIVQLIGTLIILASVDWLMLVGAVAIIPAAWFSQKTWIARIRPVHRGLQGTRQGIDAHATESFGGMRVVRGFSRERGEAARFVRSNHLLARQEAMVWWWSRIIEIVWMVLLPLGSVAVLLYGGYRVIDGTLTIGDVMMFSAYLLMLLGPLESLTVSATNIQSELAAFDRVLDLLAEPREFEAAAGAGAEERRQARRAIMGRREPRDPDLVELDERRVQGRLSLRNVSFKYPGRDEAVLEGINLEVPAGATVALVGPSGSGKTTLCNLVARFYDPTSGAIELDGVDLRRITVESYRRLLGIVEQDVFLFDGTVRENIAFALPGTSFERLRGAAVAANADGFIQRLENGYDTLIGERGVRLSGGQKQRIAIARALLADPKILILDEATSNLDSESEALIQESLRVLMRGRTCFVIAHRLSTIRHADIIVVLEHGRVVETGTHEQLAEREGRYWEMLRRQLHPSAEAARRLVEPDAGQPG